MTTDDLNAISPEQWSELLRAMRRDTDHGVLPGTYVKVVASGPSRFPRDSFLVLYLRPSGMFLFLGYSGYERTLAAGRWSMTSEAVQLEGFGRVDGCCPDSAAGGPFQRTFRYSTNHSSPVLTADEELPGWSLLSHAGAYSYLGWEVVFDPNRGWLPPTIEDVDNLIDRFAQ